MGQKGQAASAFAVYMLFRFLYEALQTYLYWLMGEVVRGTGSAKHGTTGQEDAISGGGNGMIARTTGILRSWESIGSTIAYAVGAVGVSNLKQMVLGFVLWGVTVPFTLWAIYGEWTPVLEEEEEEEEGKKGAHSSGASVSGEDVEGRSVMIVVGTDLKS